MFLQAKICENNKLHQNNNSQLVGEARKQRTAQVDHGLMAPQVDAAHGAVDVPLTAKEKGTC